MSSSPVRRTLLVLLLAALLTASSALAAGPTPAAPSLLARAWSLLASLWGEEGCHLDPSGRCVTAPKIDTGCNVDPDGRCVH
ncbi:MAG TPA: hypothetical protein VFE33_05820 [Thermoanaerobaculia bacterium]|nr:hypothetical protein [Thermoanaerobaculia bacterium]